MTHAAPGSRTEWGAWLAMLIAVLTFAAILCWPNPEPVAAANGEPAGTSLRLSPAAQRLAAVTALMSVLWVSQAIPIGVTSLIPVFAFPLLGIQTSKRVAESYMDQSVLLFLGGFMIALGIERWGLHKRIALGVMSIVGGTPRRAVLGAMIATGGLSMWISNTASTLLMLPIAIALLETLRGAVREVAAEDGSSAIDETTFDVPFRRLGIALMLGIAYSASIGGFTTLVGTPTNIAFLKVWGDRFPAGPSIGTGAWMLSIVPIGGVLLIATWGLLVSRLPQIPGSERFRGRFFVERLRALGRPSRSEWLMLVVFLATAVLWITREDLKFGDFTLLPGWTEFMARRLSGWGVTADHLHDSTVSILMAVLLFALPGEPDDEGRPTRLMDWRTAVKLPWEVLLLFGGGFALANGFKETGFADWLGMCFADGFQGQGVWLIVLGTCLLMTFLTEFTSNVATVSALLPVLASAAVAMRIDPRLLMIPAAVSASCAFMLPIGTPPNAIVFGSGRLTMRDMAVHGVLLNLLGALIITLATFWLIVPQMGIDLTKMPDWATAGPADPVP